MDICQAIGFNIYEGKIVIPFPKWLSNASTKTKDSASMAQSADFSTLKEFVETGFVEAAQEDTQGHVETS